MRKLLATYRARKAHKRMWSQQCQPSASGQKAAITAEEKADTDLLFGIVQSQL